MPAFTSTHSTRIAIRNANMQTRQYIARMERWMKEFQANPPSSLTYEITTSVAGKTDIFRFDRPATFTVNGTDFASTTSGYAQRFHAQLNTAQGYIDDAKARLLNR